MIGVFVAATGTGCGKTWIARGMARTCVRARRRVVALKPVETGVAGTPEDAHALGRAADRPELAHAPGLRRFRAALSPRAAELGGEPALDVDALARAVRALFTPSEVAVIEGAGGLFTPLARGATVADLARALGFPVLLAAPNALGTLSHTLATARAAGAVGLPIRAVILVAAQHPDGSERQNAAILAEELGIPVVELTRCKDDDDALADAVEAAGLGVYLL